MILLWFPCNHLLCIIILYHNPYILDNLFWWYIVSVMGMGLFWRWWWTDGLCSLCIVFFVLITYHILYVFLCFVLYIVYTILHHTYKFYIEQQSVSHCETIIIPHNNYSSQRFSFINTIFLKILWYSKPHCLYNIFSPTVIPTPVFYRFISYYFSRNWHKLCICPNST